MSTTPEAPAWPVLTAEEGDIAAVEPKPGRVELEPLPLPPLVPYLEKLRDQMAWCSLTGVHPARASATVSNRS